MRYTNRHLLTYVLHQIMYTTITLKSIKMGGAYDRRGLQLGDDKANATREPWRAHSASRRWSGARNAHHDETANLSETENEGASSRLPD